MFLLVGNRGQLGSEFASKLNSLDIEFFGFDIQDCNIASLNPLLELVKNSEPSVIINCSAYNLVDNAETDFVSAYRTNAVGVRNLALAAKKYGAKLIHYSTDYVFDGTSKSIPYTEADLPNPINEYGKSKLAGEIFLTEETDNYLIFRLSWVYGNGNQNFIHKFKEWSVKSKELKISDDEISVPTYTGTVVDVTLKALQKDLNGIYHLTNGGYASRFDWANEICNNFNLKNKIIPVSKDIFELKARRPAFSAMSNEHISDTLKISIPDWKDDLKLFIEKTFKKK